jgi:hypothetical protein
MWNFSLQLKHLITMDSSAGLTLSWQLKQVSKRDILASETSFSSKSADKAFPLRVVPLT